MIIHVIAETLEEFKDWVTKQTPRKSVTYRYLPDVESCYRIRKVPILAVANWDKRKDAVDMIAALRGRGCNFIYPEEN